MLKIINLYKIRNQQIRKWNIKDIITLPDKYIIQLTNTNIPIWHINLDRESEFELNGAYRLWTFVNGKTEALCLQKHTIANTNTFLSMIEYFVDTRMKTL